MQPGDRFQPQQICFSDEFQFKCRLRGRYDASDLEARSLSHNSAAPLTSMRNRRRSTDKDEQILASGRASGSRTPDDSNAGIGMLLRWAAVGRLAVRHSVAVRPCQSRLALY